MDEIRRMLDANINRAAEGIRILEDISRFCFSDEKITEQLKKIRHSIRKDIKILNNQCLEARDASNDIGLDISTKLDIDGKTHLDDLIKANFKRSQEAIRCCEEALKVLNMGCLSRKYEAIRFDIYSLEKEFYSLSFFMKKNNALDTDLYCITSEKHSNGRDNIEVIGRMIDTGIKVIQYRDKEKSILEKYRQCIKIRDITAQAGVTFIVNDHADLAKSVCADGIHLGQDDLPVHAVKELLGEHIIVGVSTHSPAQALKAVDEGADYIGVGPLFKTYTKDNVCDAVGLEYLDFAVENIQIPFISIGGIKLDTVYEVRKRGAKCIALVTEIVGSEDICTMIEKIRKEIERADINAV